MSKNLERLKPEYVFGLRIIVPLLIVVGWGSVYGWLNVASFLAGAFSFYQFILYREFKFRSVQKSSSGVVPLSKDSDVGGFIDV